MPGVLQQLIKAWDKLPQVPLGLYVGWSRLPQIRLLQQFDSRLPRQLELPASHVFFVTAPHHQVPVSFRHWSIYTQGYFYHLTVDDRQNKTPGADVQNFSSTSNEARSVGVLLKSQNLSDCQQPDYLTAKTGSAAKKVFIAFEVGQTMYRPEHIANLGQWIVDELATYDLWEANCQIFNIGLLNRIIMTQRDGSIFSGNLAQLVDWDLRGRHSESEASRNPSTLEVGFLLRPPGLQPQTLFHSLAYMWTSTRYITSAKRIRILYEKGPRAIRAYSSSGQKGERSELWDSTTNFVRESKQNLSQATREFREDIRARKWLDAFLGREEAITRSLEQQLEKKARGHPLALPQVERTLLFLRRVLQSQSSYSSHQN